MSKSRQMTSRDNFAALHTMLRRAFAYMEGRIDPPSSMANMSVEDLRNTSEASEIWVIEEADRPIASVTLTPTDSTLYLDKLATSPTHRQEGLARELLTLAENRAQALNLSSITLNTRVELVDNHATFHAMGFEYVGEATHKGFDHPTSLIYRKTL